MEAVRRLVVQCPYLQRVLTLGSPQKAATIRDGFATLIAELKTFRNGFQKFDQGRESANRTKMKELQEKIDYLYKEIDK